MSDYTVLGDGKVYKIGPRAECEIFVAAQACKADDRNHNKPAAATRMIWQIRPSVAGDLEKLRAS